MELKGRLSAIASKIPVCETLADIGTDHAYIPIYAVMKGFCKNAIAADVREGPVKIAERNIKRFALEDRIEARLGCGLEPLEPDEVDVAVIAGMGGPLICDILRASVEKAKAARLLILQPMNVLEAVRKWLNEEGFSILEEILAPEGRKLYNIICTAFTGNSAKQDDYELYAGRELLRGKDPMLKDYLERKLKQLDVIIKGKEVSEPESFELRNLKAIRSRMASNLVRVIGEGDSI